MDGVGWQRKLVQKQWGSVAATPEVKVTRQFYSGQNPTGPCGRRQEPYWAWLLGKHSLPPVGKLSSKLALSWLKPATSPATGGPSWAHDAAIYWPRLGLVPSWCLLQTLWPLHTMTWSSNIFALCTQPCQPHLLVLLHSAHPEHLLLPAFFAHAVLSAWKSILQDLVWGLFFFFSCEIFPVNTLPPVSWLTPLSLSENTYPLHPSPRHILWQWYSSAHACLLYWVINILSVRVRFLNFLLQAYNAASDI